MNKTTRRRLAKYKRRIKKRLENMSRENPGKPAFSAGNIHYELADRGGGVALLAPLYCSGFLGRADVLGFFG